ncbi:hypothetical protein AZE42_12538 [Rhizopogon vesiculosus]|uniref:Uncharacterized protein n=1 Tax=Rhizopogon vesiculosus TaxID=180088 RepID=A0A1J8PNS9_9AGAM|nr:hypothetical protein AZE42_12538 [Rhizopogon vesiculosus]
MIEHSSDGGFNAKFYSNPSDEM